MFLEGDEAKWYVVESESGQRAADRCAANGVLLHELIRRLSCSSRFPAVDQNLPPKENERS